MIKLHYFLNFITLKLQHIFLLCTHNMKCGCISEHKHLHVNLLWNNYRGVKPRKLLNAIRILPLEGVTQLTCIKSKDKLIEGPGSVSCWTKINLYLLHWFLDKFIAVHKLWLRWRVHQHIDPHTASNYQTEWRDTTSTLLSKTTVYHWGAFKHQEL